MNPLCLAAAFALGAWAPVGASTPASRADLLRQQAEEAYRGGDHLGALSFLEQAYAADPQPAILANRGLVLERLGDTRRAVADFEAYLATNPPPEKRATAETAVRRLRPDVLIGADRPGISLFLDDQPTPVGVTPLRLALNAGAHLIRFEGQGVLPGQMAFVVEPGREQAVQLQVVPQTTPTADAGDTDPSEARARTWSYVSLGTGVVTAIAGGAFTLMMQGRKDDRDAATSRSAWKSADASAERYQTAAGAAFGVSAAAVATGLYFWFSGD